MGSSIHHHSNAAYSRNTGQDVHTMKKKKTVEEPKEQRNYQVWYKVTMRSHPKLGVVLPGEQYNEETAKEVAKTMKEQFHWAAVSVVVGVVRP